MNPVKNRIVCSTLFVGLAASASQVLAHHPLEGQPMETLLHGLLSGVAHPVLGIDHLLFIIAIGMAGALSRRVLIAPLFVIVGVFIGVALSLMGVQLPWTEPAIAISLVIVGASLFGRKALSPKSAAALFTLLGVFHGLAYASVLAGQESVLPAVLIGYLSGLALIQWVIAAGTGTALQRLMSSTLSWQKLMQVAGALVATAGVSQLIASV